MFYSTQSLVEMLLNEADVVEDPFASKTSATNNNSSEQPTESSNKVEDPFASKTSESDDTSSPETSTEDGEESSPSEETEESPGNKVDDPFLGDHPDGAETTDAGKPASNENNLSTINIGGKSEQDTPALREYFFNNFNDFYTQYDSLKNLISSVQKQVGGTSSTMTVLEQLNDKINSNRKMVDNFFKEDLIVSGEIEVIFKIYKIHQTDIRLITTTLKDICRSVFNRDIKKDNKKKS